MGAAAPPLRPCARGRPRTTQTNQHHDNLPQRSQELGAVQASLFRRIVRASGRRGGPRVGGVGTRARAECTALTVPAQWDAVIATPAGIIGRAEAENLRLREDRKISASEAEEALNRLVRDQWLMQVDDSSVTLSPWIILEFSEALQKCNINCRACNKIAIKVRGRLQLLGAAYPRAVAGL